MGGSGRETMRKEASSVRRRRRRAEEGDVHRVRPTPGPRANQRQEYLLLYTLVATPLQLDLLYFLTHTRNNPSFIARTPTYFRIPLFRPCSLGSSHSVALINPLPFFLIPRFFPFILMYALHECTPFIPLHHRSRISDI